MKVHEVIRNVCGGYMPYFFLTITCGDHLSFLAIFEPCEQRKYYALR